MFSNMSTRLGLLGTVIGLIGAFAALGSADPTEKADLLSRGISEAMNCTAFGLVVAFPTLIVHAWLQAKTTELIDSLEAACTKSVSPASRNQSVPVLGIPPDENIVPTPPPRPPSTDTQPRGIPKTPVHYPRDTN